MTRTAKPDLPADALPVVPTEPTEPTAESTDAADTTPPLPDDTDLSADDRLTRLENRVADLETNLLSSDSIHGAHHRRLDSSGYTD